MPRNSAIWRVAIWLVPLLLSVLGILARLPARDGRALWVDELWRVNLVLDPTLLQSYVSAPNVYTAITAPLYALGAKLIGFFGTSPDAMRLLSFIPSVAAILVAFQLVMRARGGVVLAIFVGLVFALNVNFIQYANEFKPYMFEVFVHVFVIYAWFGVIGSGEPAPGRWITALVVLYLSVLSAANVVFILPALYVTLGLKALTQGDLMRRRILIALVGHLVLVGLLYRFVWAHGSNDELTRYWSAGFPDSHASGVLGFLKDQAVAMWFASFNIFGFGAILPGIVAKLGVFLTAFAVIEQICLARRGSLRDCIQSPRVQLVVFYLIFIATVVALNLLKKWPLGAIRPNVFLYAHIVIGVALMASTMPRWKWVNLSFVIPLILIFDSVSEWRPDALVQYGSPPEQNDRVWAAFLPESGPGSMILRDCANGRRTHVFYNAGMFHSIAYYRMRVRNHEIPDSVLDSPCVQLVPLSEPLTDAAVLRNQVYRHASANDSVWLLYAHLVGDEIEHFRKAIYELGSPQDTGQDNEFIVAGFFKVKLN